jgi:hypothetical protein
MVRKRKRTLTSMLRRITVNRKTAPNSYHAHHLIWPSNEIEYSTQNSHSYIMEIRPWKITRRQSLAIIYLR